MDTYYFKTPFATSGDKTAIPLASQPSGDVSYTDGFTPDYDLELGVDPNAKPVPRDQTNQFYFAVSENLKQYQEYGTPQWITSANNGGSPFSYSKGARVQYTDGAVWVSLVNTNTAEPSTDATKWALASTIETRGASFGSIVSVSSTPYTMVATNYGYQHIFSGSASIAATMCAIAGASIGQSFNIVNHSANYTHTIARDGGSTFSGTTGYNGTSTLITLPPNAAVIITKKDATTWDVQGLQGGLLEQILSFGSISSAAYLEFILSSLDKAQSYSNIYELDLINFNPANDDVHLHAVLSSNGGSSYESTLYDSAVSGRCATDSASGAERAATNKIASAMTLLGFNGSNNSLGTGANEKASCKIRMVHMNTGGSTLPWIKCDGIFYDASGLFCTSEGGGSRKSAGTYDAIKISMQTGNFDASGKFILRKLLSSV